MSDSMGIDFYPSTASTSRQQILAGQVKHLQHDLEVKKTELERKTDELEAARGELLCCRSIAQAAIFARQEQVAALRQNLEILTAALAEARAKAYEPVRTTVDGSFARMTTQHDQDDPESKRRKIEHERQTLDRERQEFERTRNEVEGEQKRLQRERQKLETEREGLESQQHRDQVDVDSALAAARARWEAARVEDDRRLRDQLIKEIESDLEVTRRQKRRLSSSKNMSGDTRWSPERVLTLRICSAASSPRSAASSLASATRSPGPASSDSVLIHELREELEQALRVQEVLRSQLSIAQRISTINNNADPQRRRISEASSPPTKKPVGLPPEDTDGLLVPPKAAAPIKPFAKRSTRGAAAASVANNTNVPKRTRRGKIAGGSSAQGSDTVDGGGDFVAGSPPMQNG